MPCPPINARYVRQGSELWSRAHDGRITTGGLLGALGWRHEKAAARLGLHRDMRGGEHLQRAYLQLLAGPNAELEASLRAGGGRTGSSVSGAAGGGGSGGSVNEQRRAAYNARLRNAVAGEVDVESEPALCCCCPSLVVAFAAAADCSPLLPSGCLACLSCP